MPATLPPLPWPLRIANGAASVAPSFPSLDPDDLIARARRRANLHDLGDPPIDEPLRRLVADLERGGLSLTGRIAVRSLLDELLLTRLEIADALARHPEAADLPIERPLFIL